VKVADALSRLGDFQQAVIVTRDQQGYPFSVATDFVVVDGTVALTPARTGIAGIPAEGDDVRLLVSHIRPRPGYGYDERAYIELAGKLDGDSERWIFQPRAARGWDEKSLPFIELCERALPQARRYLATLSRDRGIEVRPRMSVGWRFFLATRLPFLTATLIPVFLGIAAAATDHHVDWGLALLTLLGAVSVHLGLNIANDIFDALSGADDANVTPTMFSGGSRVIQYGLVTLRQMAVICAVCYAIAIAVGLTLVALTGIGLLWVGLAGVLISWFYTAPPLRLVHRGLGELAVALGFGPIMVLGAYYVQTQHYTLKAGVLSIPVALLVMLILYANEIPDRSADAKAGKRTLVVRMSKDAVVRGYEVSVALVYVAIVVGAALRIVPWPTLIALLTIPLAISTARGLREHYDKPYEVMASLQNNVVLHFVTGLLLIAGTAIGIAVG
jgi:1,4-dihydroxy-2-naphthoate octaprenyltransferase